MSAPTPDGARETLRRLASPVPSALIRSKRRGGATLRFLSWYDAEDLMDERAPLWTKEIKEVGQVEAERPVLDERGEPTGRTERVGMVYMVVRVGVKTSEGWIHREASGNELDVTASYGDPFSNAESMATRRALANFGLGRELYHGQGIQIRRELVARERRERYEAERRSGDEDQEPSRDDAEARSAA